MRNSLIFLAIIISVFIFSACKSDISESEDNKSVVNENNNIQNDNETKANQINTLEKEDNEEQYNSENSNNEMGKTAEYISHENNPLLKLAYEGKIDGIDFGIGSYSGDIVKKWGIPDRYDNFMGGLYLAYDDKDVVFSTNTFMDDGQITYADVIWIGFWGENREIFNVRIGMTFEEIEEVLGRSSSKETPYENQDSELYCENWTITYDIGCYLLKFITEEVDGPVDVVYLFVKN